MRPPGIPRAPVPLVWAGRLLGAVFALFISVYVAERLARAARELLGPLMSADAADLIEGVLGAGLALPGVLALFAVPLYGAAAARRARRGESARDELAEQPALVTAAVVAAWCTLRAPTAAAALACALRAPPGLGAVAAALHFHLGVTLLRRWVDEAGLREAVLGPGWTRALRRTPWNPSAVVAAAVLGLQALDPNPQDLSAASLRLAGLALFGGWSFAFVLATR